MVVCTWTDMLGCYGKFTKDNDMDALKKAGERFLGGLDKMCPAKGFLHGRMIPSIGDVMLYSTIKNGTYGAEKQGLDYSAFGNVKRICNAVEKCLNMGGFNKMKKKMAMMKAPMPKMYMGVKPSLYYFDLPYRAAMARTALRIGCVDFDDKRCPKDFDWPKMKEDKTSIAWTKSFGFVPIMERGDFFVSQGQAVLMYCGDIALRGYELNAEQRAFDLMMVATW
jgi:hypothetical protein